MSSLLKLTALWKGEAKDGRTYLAGNLGDARIFVMSNKYAKSERDPSHFVFLAQQDKRRGKATGGTDIDEIPF